jgi:hypothetical protein
MLTMNPILGFHWTATGDRQRSSYFKVALSSGRSRLLAEDLTGQTPAAFPINESGQMAGFASATRNPGHQTDLKGEMDFWRESSWHIGLWEWGVDTTVAPSSRIKAQE